MEEKVDIMKRYEREIMDIKNKLDKLEKGRIYELTKSKMDGYLSTNIEQLRKMIWELIYKIEYDKDSMNDEIEKELKKIGFWD